MAPALTIEQLRQISEALQRELQRIENMLASIDSLPENASAEQMLRVLISIEKTNLGAQAEDIRSKLESLRPAMSNIILATPVPGGHRQ